MTMDQTPQNPGESRWVMSRYASCQKLTSIDSGPVKLVLRRKLPVMTHL